mmetsp:Transcript_12773/g.28335  ORF Transcript_12773/g.28335 Transcript_12773/m.28335 type:complete len:189 (-) Transcript_12773:248-814(-)
MRGVPSLKHGDFVMYESAAINTYLGDVFRGKDGVPELVPAPGTHARGRYEQVVSFLCCEIDSQCLWVARKHKDLGHLFGAFPEAVAAAQKYYFRCLNAMIAEFRALGTEYLVGHNFSAADILFCHCISWANAIQWLTESVEKDGAVTEEGIEPQNFQFLNAYWEKCKERPSFKAMEKRKQEAVDAASK